MKKETEVIYCVELLGFALWFCVCQGRNNNFTISSFNYSLHLGIQSGPCEDELIRLDEAYVQNKYKVSC